MRVAAIIRNGLLCKNCTATKCVDIGNDIQQNLIDCPMCSGVGCDDCNGGTVKIVGCPNAMIRELVPVIELIDFFWDKVMPVAGGLLDQSASFVQAARCFKYDEQQIKAER